MKVPVSETGFKGKPEELYESIMAKFSNSVKHWTDDMESTVTKNHSTKSCIHGTLRHNYNQHGDTVSADLTSADRTKYSIEYNKYYREYDKVHVGEWMVESSIIGGYVEVLCGARSRKDCFLFDNTYSPMDKHYQDTARCKHRGGLGDKHCCHELVAKQVVSEVYNQLQGESK